MQCYTTWIGVGGGGGWEWQDLRPGDWGKILVYYPPSHHHHITTHTPMHPPLHRPMHSPACPSGNTPIQPHLTYTERDYTILLLMVKILYSSFRQRTPWKRFTKWANGSATKRRWSTARAWSSTSTTSKLRLTSIHRFGTSSRRLPLSLASHKKHSVRPNSSKKVAKVHYWAMKVTQFRRTQWLHENIFKDPKIIRTKVSKAKIFLTEKLWAGP